MYLLESLSSRKAGWWWLLFHLGFPVRGVTLPQGALLCTLKEEGVVGITVEGQLCIVCGGVLLEWGRQKGSSVRGGKRPDGFPMSGFCFLLIQEIWAQQDYEEEALRVQGKTDSGEDKGLWCDDCGSFSCLLSPFLCPSFGLA